MVYIRYNNNLDGYIDYNDTDIYNQLTMNYQDRLNFDMDNFIDERFSLPGNQSVGHYDLGTYGNLQKNSIVGDGLDLHHVPASAVLKNLDPNYRSKNGLSIALTRDQHRKFHLKRGYKPNHGLTLNQNLARDVMELRRLGVPDSKIKEIIDFNVGKYSEHFSDRSVERSSNRQNKLHLNLKYDDKFGINPYGLKPTQLEPTGIIITKDGHVRSKGNVPYAGILQSFVGDSVEGFASGLREDPSAVLTFEGMTNVLKDSAGNITGHMANHATGDMIIYGLKIAGSEVTVPVTLVYTGGEFSVCLDSYQKELYDIGFHYKNAEKVIQYCTARSALTAAGSYSFGSDMVTSAIKGFIRPTELEKLNTKNMTFWESARNNSEYYTFQALAAPGKVIHYATGSSENKIENESYDNVTKIYKDNNIDPTGFMIVPIDGQIPDSFDKNNISINGGVVSECPLTSNQEGSNMCLYTAIESNDNPYFHVGGRLNANQSKSIEYNSYIDGPIVLLDRGNNKCQHKDFNCPLDDSKIQNENFCCPFDDFDNDYNSTTNRDNTKQNSRGSDSKENHKSSPKVKTINNKTATKPKPHINPTVIKNKRINKSATHKNSMFELGTGGLFDSIGSKDKPNPDSSSNGFINQLFSMNSSADVTSPNKHDNQTDLEQNKVLESVNKHDPDPQLDSDQNKVIDSANKPESQNDSVSNEDSQSESVDKYNLSSKKDIMALQEEVFKVFKQVKDLREENIKDCPWIGEINQYTSDVNELLGKSLMFKNWDKMDNDTKLRVSSAVIVGSLVRFDSICKALELDNSQISNVVWACSLMESGVIKVDKIVGSIIENQFGIPTGGIFSFVHGLVHNSKIGQVLEESAKNIFNDFMSYLVPEYALVRSLYQGIEMGKELITTHDQLKIGSFNVATVSRMSLHGFELNEKYSIYFPTLDIHVAGHGKESSEAEKVAISKFKKEALEKCYAYYGIPFDCFCPEDSIDYGFDNEDSINSSESNKNGEKPKMPRYADIVKNIRMKNLLENWQSVNNLTDEDKEKFNHQMFENDDSKDVRIRNEILDIKDSFFHENSDLDPISFMSKFVEENKFNNPTEALKSIYHLFFATGHYKTDELVLPDVIKTILKYVGVNVDEFLEYVNHMNDLQKEGEESLEEKIKKQKELESTDYGVLLERYKKSRIENSNNGDLRSFESDQDQEIISSSKDEVDPMIIFVEFLRWFGINPGIVLGNGRIEAIDSKHATKGAFSRENVIFWLNKETIKSHLSVGMITSTACSSGIGTIAGTLAYIDVEAKTIYNTPGKFIILKTKQWASSSIQSHTSSLITNLTFNTFTCTKFSNQFSDKVKNIIKINLGAGVSFAVGGVATMLNGNYRKKSFIDNAYDITETIIKNNSSSIHSFLVEQFSVWKSMTGYVTSFGVWVSDFLTQSCADSYLYKLIYPYASYIMGVVNPGNMLVYSTIMVLSSRLIKSTIMGAIGVIRRFLGYDKKSIRENDEEKERIRKERLLQLENKSLIDMYVKVIKSEKANIQQPLEDRVFKKMLESELQNRELIKRRFQFKLEEPMFKPMTDEEKKDLESRLPKKSESPDNRNTVVTKVSNPTRVTKVNKPTTVTQVSNPTRVTQVSNPTRVTQVSNPTRVTKVSNPTRVTQVSNPTRVTKVSNPTRVTKVSKPTRVTKVKKNELNDNIKCEEISDVEPVTAIPISDDKDDIKLKINSEFTSVHAKYVKVNESKIKETLNEKFPTVEVIQNFISNESEFINRSDNVIARPVLAQ